MRTFRCEKWNLAQNKFQECIISEGNTLWTFKCAAVCDSVNRIVVCVSLARMIFIFLSLSVIWVILCANLENYLVRVSVPSSAVLLSSWLRLAGQSASVDRFSFRPMILFFLWHSFYTASWFCFSLSATSLHLRTNTLLYYLIFLANILGLLHVWLCGQSWKV